MQLYFLQYILIWLSAMWHMHNQSDHIWYLITVILSEILDQCDLIVGGAYKSQIAETM